jgi:hypothetical protein
VTGAPQAGGGDQVTGAPRDGAPRAGGSGGDPVAAGYSPAWLRLREPADARARAADLVDLLREWLGERPADRPGDRPGGAGLVVHDLGCGTGSMGRWLAGRLPGPQRWTLHDRDPALLAHAAAGLPAHAADGTPVTARTRVGDVAALTAADLAGAALVTTSALLDLLTAEEVGRLAAACAGAGCPALLTLSVAGRVALAPADPLDADVAAAFDAHQRRVSDGRRLLGPDAAGAAADAFAARGARVTVRPSPWRLDAEHAALAAEWLRGWVAAAVEERPELAPAARAYLDRRLAQATAGDLRVEVGHEDLLALF